jgi:hypothetical protein
LTTFNGLPIHILLNHFIVVLAPLTAILAIICAVWPAARRRLVWLVLALSIVTLILTPLTTDAGQWLQKKVKPSPSLQTHTVLGDTMIYFSVALVVAAVMLAVIHVAELRHRSLKSVAAWLIAAFVIIVSVAVIVQVYRIGDAGAQATWGDLGG